MRWLKKLRFYRDGDSEKKFLCKSHDSSREFEKLYSYPKRILAESEERLLANMSTEERLLLRRLLLQMRENLK